jgi:hypothetical protein
MKLAHAWYNHCRQAASKQTAASFKNVNENLCTKIKIYDFEI